jgi:hypothetical protein
MLVLVRLDGFSNCPVAWQQVSAELFFTRQDEIE